MQRVYLDSNVFISFIKQEMDPNFRLLHQEAEDFLDNCPNRFVLILSNLAITEIERKIHYSKEAIQQALNEKNILIEFVQRVPFDSHQARELVRRGMHYADALHASIAINTRCNAIVTFNIKDFETVKKFIRVCEPTELID